MIKIKKSPNADSRTAEGGISKEELLRSTWLHISDVQQALAFMAEKLIGIGLAHDHTKISGIDQFYADFASGRQGADFKQLGWFSGQHLTERHHLTDRVPDDVNLFDVLERVADITVAGMARSGEVYDDCLDGELLQRAYRNTVDLLKKEIEVFEEGSDD